MSETTEAVAATTGTRAEGAEQAQRVGIIGAGIAGLVTAKIFLENGFDVQVFEKEPDLGGVWALSRAYPGLRANTAKETYSLTDYPYPASTSGYPVAEEVRAHLESYADHFGLYPHISFNSEVVRLAEIDDNGRQGFSMTVRSRADVNEEESREHTHEFAYVLICSGAFSTPIMPDLPGRKTYRGLVRHSSEWTHPAVADVRRVVVIGAGKSALDCAAWAAREGKTSTLVFRKPHWMVPRYLPGGARSDLRFISRFIEMFVNYPVRPWDEKLLHGPGKPLVWLWWTFLSAVVPRVLGMPKLMTPEHKLPVGFESVGQVDDFFDLLNVDRITAIRAGVKGFYDLGVELDDGTQIEADLVIMGTGWQRDMSFLS
ncbi:MAG: NAD(P)/FAD-dependent oxidoreductase, partial [Gammaproteobacteria bacterium]|nr:NAD(P)/FAD-dependent oxidoreductase [Gammaproteobacteria bacterium]